MPRCGAGGTIHTAPDSQPSIWLRDTAHCSLHPTKKRNRLAASKTQSKTMLLRARSNILNSHFLAKMTTANAPTGPKLGWGGRAAELLFSERPSAALEKERWARRRIGGEYQQYADDVVYSQITATDQIWGAGGRVGIGNGKSTRAGLGSSGLA